MAAPAAIDGGRLPRRYLTDLPATIARLRSAWEAYQSGAGRPPQVRTVIADSWERSARRRISPDRRAAELDNSSLRGFQPLDSMQRALRLAAAPVVAELERELSSTNSAVVVCDEFGSILDRAGDRTILRRTERQNFIPGAIWNEDSAGTNGIGLALALGRPAQVLGGEHFCVGFQAYACSAAPVRHPVTRAVVGLLDVTSDAREASPLAYALVAQAASAVERRMQEHLLGRERALLELYLRGRVARSSPLLTVDRAGRTVIQNAPAAEQLASEDVSAALALAREALRSGTDVSEVLSFSRGLARVQVHVARSEEEVIGAVIAVSTPGRARAPAGRPPGDWGPLVAASPAMQRLLRQAERAALQSTPLLIEGEAGSGKLTLARELHRRAGRPEGTLVVVSAARGGWRQVWQRALAGRAATIVLRRLSALSDREQLELADELDELLEAPAGPGIDADAGPLAATGPLSGVGADARGAPRVIALLGSDEQPPRSELLHRLAGGRLTIPPLRVRRGDLDGLLRVWSARRCQRGLPAGEVSPAARAALAQHPWPGNVRELFAVLDAAALISPTLIRVQDLRLESAADAAGCSLRELERRSILDALQRSAGNVSRAAELLGVSRATLYRRLSAYRALGTHRALGGAAGDPAAVRQGR
jgi:transcriptional regulator of acetoin/glycerol metabolism